MIPIYTNTLPIPSFIPINSALMLDVELNAKRSKFIAHRKLISISLMSIGISICLVFMRLDVWGNNVFVCDSIGLCVVEIAPGHR